jgi:hypothetical protein
MRKDRSEGSRPRIRSEGLLAEEVAGEVLIYDLGSHQAHCLNQSAAIVWRHCDGTRTIAELGSLLDPSGLHPIGGDAARYAVDELRSRDLLEDQPEVEADTDRSRGRPSIARRELLRKAVVRGVALGFAIPVIKSIVAPTPAHAFSCLPSGSPCASSAQCCSGICLSNRCL